MKSITLSEVKKFVKPSGVTVEVILHTIAVTKNDTTNKILKMVANMPVITLVAVLGLFMKLTPEK
ncbi:MAG: hypothetical protein IKV40_03130 [Clostridia bacterium]|nr:hypothetical protein [Clostridia bacterium]